MSIVTVEVTVTGLEDLRECIRLLLSERTSDVLFLQKANNSYIAVLKLLQQLESLPRRSFDSVVGKINGRYGYIDLDHVLPRKEHEGLFLALIDRKTAGMKGTVSSTANRQLGPSGRTYVINIYCDPSDLDDDDYNTAFRSSVARWFSRPKNREHYVHEFVHVLDYRRMTDDYLTSRAAVKRANREAGRPKDFNAYMNDPMETNAYTHQSFVRVKNRLKGVETRSEWESVMGRSPHEFVDLFLNSYLDRRARRHWSDHNVRKLVKRAVAFYQNMEPRAPQ